MTIVSCVVPEIWSAAERIFCHLGPFLALLTPLTTKKIKMLEKWRKKHLGISSFYTSAPKIIIICYTILEIWHVTDVIIFHFGLFFTLLPLPPHPISTKNQIKKKMKKTLGDIIILHVPNIMIRWCMASEIWCAMYGWTDGRADFFTFIKTLNI